MEIRRLTRDEVDTVWSIDRREQIDRVYRLRDGELVPEQHDFFVPGWRRSDVETYTPLLHACFERGGALWGCFDRDVLAGVAVLDTVPRGPDGELRQLLMLQIGCDYRGKGVGTKLFELARDEARRQGARGLYISATPSEKTVRFYQGRGAVVTAEPDPELLALEPDDIHLVCPL